MKNFLGDEANEFAVKSAPFGFVRPQAIAEVFDGKSITVEGRKMVDCTRLDYISLGSNPRVKEIMIDAISGNNLSCPASQIVMKTTQNIELEDYIADFHGMKSSVVFLSGYAANQNSMSALGLRMNTPYFQTYRREGDMGRISTRIPTIFFVDAESHFSLRQGIKMARTQTKLCISYDFRSGDYESLEHKIRKSIKEHGEDAVRVIVSDTLSSVSGRIFDINALSAVAEKYDCWMYLDEAHAIGAMGPGGRGIAAGAADFSGRQNKSIVMGTLTKAVSMLGGYVAMGDENLCAMMRTFSPQYIFSAPVPPWMAEATVNVMKLIAGEYGDVEREKLVRVSDLMRDNLEKKEFSILNSNSHIIPVVVGEVEKAISVQEYLEAQGFLASLFTYPAVPRDSALVRFSLCSDISEGEVMKIVKGLTEARDKFKF